MHVGWKTLRSTTYTYFIVILFHYSSSLYVHISYHMQTYIDPSSTHFTHLYIVKICSILLFYFPFLSTYTCWDFSLRSFRSGTVLSFNTVQLSHRLHSLSSQLLLTSWGDRRAGRKSNTVLLLRYIRDNEHILICSVACMCSVACRFVCRTRNLRTPIANRRANDDDRLACAEKHISPPRDAPKFATVYRLTAIRMIGEHESIWMYWY